MLILGRLFRRGGRGGGKDILYARLSEAMESPGCPICRLLLKAERELIEEILYEHVQDPQVRGMLRESLGLCPYHAWMLHDITLARPEMDGLGSTIIYEDMLSTYYDALKEGREDQVGGGSCLVCEHMREFEEGYVGAFVERIVTSDLLSKYAGSQSTLCVRHYSAVVKALTRRRGCEEVVLRLKEVQLRKIESILNEMREYVRKQDYLVKEEVTPEEARAWRIALETLKGGRVSLNILRAKPPEPRKGLLGRWLASL